MTAMDTSLPATEQPSPKPRSPWLAGFLSLFGPLGQIYVGRMRRSLCLWLILGCLVPLLVFFAMSLPREYSSPLLLLVCLLAVPAIPVYCAVDAFLLARRNRHAPLKRYQRWWVYAVFFAFFYSTNLATAHFVHAFVVESFSVPTRGMSPTIMAGDHFIADKLWYKRKPIQRNDVVVQRSGEDSSIYVRRVIGIPGDEIEIKNERMFLNGQEWHDPHAVFDGPLTPIDKLSNYGPTKVPADSCFLLGDNRRLSRDSRIEGPYPLSSICGMARWIYWSRERIFPDPNDTRHYVPGAIRWNRLGQRLD